MLLPSQAEQLEQRFFPIKDKLPFAAAAAILDPFVPLQTAFSIEVDAQDTVEDVLASLGANDDFADAVAQIKARARDVERFRLRKASRECPLSPADGGSTGQEEEDVGDPDLGETQPSFMAEVMGPVRAPAGLHRQSTTSDENMAIGLEVDGFIWWRVTAPERLLSAPAFPAGANHSKCVLKYWATSGTFAVC